MHCYANKFTGMQYIYIDTKDRYDEKSILPRNTYNIPPQEHTAMTTTVHISQISDPTR